MKVLLANDDGIMAKGIRALYAAFINRGHEVAAIAPMVQQSGVSHAITVFEPLSVEYVHETHFDGIGVFGTPADCVKLGLAELCPFTPELVVAGINLGKNVGPDIFYSGTIGAAAEGAQAGIPAMAFSHANAEAEDHQMAEAALQAVLMAEKTNWQDLRPGIVVNVNFPAMGLAECSGVAICPQADAAWINGYRENRDPRNKPYWWMTGELDWERVADNSDVGLLAKGYITVTPLMFEHTAKKCLEPLTKMDFKISCFNI